jgi:hypothetical protein
MGLHEFQKLLHSKRNGFQIEETVHRVKKVFAGYTSDKGLVIYRGIKKLNSPKINEQIKKWATELSRYFQSKKSKWLKKH